MNICLCSWKDNGLLDVDFSFFVDHNFQVDDLFFLDGRPSSRAPSNNEVFLLGGFESQVVDFMNVSCGGLSGKIFRNKNSFFLGNLNRYVLSRLQYGGISTNHDFFLLFNYD